MTNNELETVVTTRNATTPHTPGSEATRVEQSRAVAEVQAAVLVAQNMPRSIEACMRSLREACSQFEFADRAFFRMSRGGETVNGPTVHLAREIARCFGNMDYGIKELSRNPKAGEHGQSEMMAYAWDQETNVRQSNTFIVPWERHTRRQGVVGLTAPNELYENNANMGARRMREAILAVVPTWITEQAKEWCMETLSKKGGDKPFPQQVHATITAFEEFRVTKRMLETKIGRNTSEWVPADLAVLRVIWRSLRNSEVSIEDEFPDVVVDVNDLVGEITQEGA